MTFNANDIYVAGGKDKIYNLWTPGVRKFDSNSFYNWEEDNIPIYDLEDRTYYLWEKLGSQSSSIDGAVLTVSADASGHVVNATTGQTAYDLDPNIFVDVSSAINALPEVLRYPVRIEICNFGSLGSLNLKNIKLVDRGALEIVNRNFAKIGLGFNRTGCKIQDNAVVTDVTQGVPTNVFASGVSSIDLTQMLSASAGLAISALELSASLASGIGDQRFTNSGCAFFFLQQAALQGNPTGNLVRRASTMTAGTPNAAFKPSTYVFGMQPYDQNDDFTVSGYDMSSIVHPTNDGTILRLNREGYSAEQMDDVNIPLVSSDNISTGLFYGNYFDTINIQNCDGPIYVRNMHVNGTDPSKIGASLTGYDNDIGIRIQNSDVVLENATAWRCNAAGIEINNSTVNLSRGCVAYRNYRQDDRANDTSGAGLKIFNSNITVSSGYESVGSDMLFSFNRNTNGVIIDNSIVRGGYWRREPGTPSSVGTIQAYENNVDGFNISNSRLDIDGKIEAWENTNGFNLTNSELQCDELEAEYNQEIGMNLKNSHFLYGKNLIPVTVVNTRNVNYRENSTENGTGVRAQTFGEAIDSTGQVHYHWNGVHLVMDNSTYKFQPLGPFVTTFGLGRSKFKLNFKRVQTSFDDAVSGVTVPGIQMRNNSQGKFFQTAIFTEGIAESAAEGIGTYVGGLANPLSGAGYGGSTSGLMAGTSNPAYGSCISVKHNSTGEFVGTGDAITHLDGPEYYYYQKYGALACAEDNSTLRFSGPTLMIRGGIDALAEDNSKIIFAPPVGDDGYVDVSAYGLSATTNHSKIDLQSSRACVVANRNSEILMHDLGDYAQPYLDTDEQGIWATSSAYIGGNAQPVYYSPSGLVLASNYSTFESSASTYGGHMQFYPNPQLQYEYATRPPYNPGTVSQEGVSLNFGKGEIDDDQSLPLIGSLDATATMAAKDSMYGLSMGGMCVRVMKGSSVDVRNVNFPTGWANTSGYFYDYTDHGGAAGSQAQIKTAANLLRMWNVDGTSHMDASFLLVSGIHPTVAGEKAPYYGAPAWYPSPGTEGLATETCYLGCPSSTRNTGVSAVCDPYGRVPGPKYKNYLDQNAAGDTTPSTVGWNTGPFRLYYSPVTAAKMLLAQPRLLESGKLDGETSSLTGNIYQMVCQGYNPSTTCSGGWGVTTDMHLYTSSNASSFLWETASPLNADWTHGVTPSFSLRSLGLGGHADQVGDREYPYIASMQFNGEDYFVGDLTMAGKASASYQDRALGTVAAEFDLNRPTFFYAKDLLPKDYWQRVRVDESAAAVWANLKCGALGPASGRSTMATVYQPVTIYGGQGAEATVSGVNAGQGFGMGFLSAEEFDLRRQD